MPPTGVYTGQMYANADIPEPFSLCPHSRKCVKGVAIAAGATIVFFLCVGVGIIIHYNFY
ncbi:Protein CBG10665 [Caenorhabditis briggsae]|uniref:Protein CBG10665 n=1 Tax=Caenorhabditis briggsae TaxID=6238 RepID=A8XBJ2_CAEBR|nr:Protein CBG10665 [Caenorhabditis briggsae]CAP30008.1 Protein CBG10665 [Caenorhabditis briggsae]